MRDPWRFRCPNEHAGWTPSRGGNSFFCYACGERFEKLKDMKTGQLVSGIAEATAGEGRS